MLKFVLVAFLFLGLAVQGQESEQTEVAKEAMNFNEKVSTKLSEDSQEEEQSQDSEEEEQSDYSAATEKVVSEDDKEEFDQEDDFGSQVLEDSKDNEEEEQNDESGWGRCWKPRCRGFLQARRVFYILRNRCHRCLSRRRGYCNKMCRIYHAHRRNRYYRCRRWINYHLRGWHHALRVNLNRIRQANAYVRRFHYLIHAWHRRCKRLSWRTVVHRRHHYWRHFLHYRRLAIAWHRARVHKYRQYRWAVGRANYYARRHRGLYYKYARLANHYARQYNYIVRRAIAYRNAMRRFYHYFKIYNHYYRIWLQIRRFIHAYHAWRRRLAYLLRRRRALWHGRNRRYVQLRNHCMRVVRHWYWRCVLCRGACGGHCWHMHRWYAVTIVRAHMCRLQHILCKRKVYYLRRYHAWNRACHYCWRRTHARLRLLVCAARCGARLKYRLMYGYYHRKCHR